MFDFISLPWQLASRRQSALLQVMSCHDAHDYVRGADRSGHAHVVECARQYYCTYYHTYIVCVIPVRTGRAVAQYRCTESVLGQVLCNFPGSSPYFVSSLPWLDANQLLQAAMAERSGGKARMGVFGRVLSLGRNASEENVLRSKVSDLLRDQLRQKKPSVGALSKTFDSYEQEHGIEIGGADGSAAVSTAIKPDYLYQVCVAADDIFAEDGAAMELLPCLIYLYFKFKKFQDMLQHASSRATPAEVRKEASSVMQLARLFGQVKSVRKKATPVMTSILHKWLFHIAAMLDEFDSNIMDKEGFSDNFKALLVSFSADNEKGLFLQMITDVVEAQSASSDLLSRNMHFSKAVFTLMRLDMKYCYLCNVQSSSVWNVSRYTHLKWPDNVTLTPQECFNGILLAIEHCRSNGFLIDMGLEMKIQLLEWLCGHIGTLPIHHKVTVDELCAVQEMVLSFLGPDSLHFDRILSPVVKANCSDAQCGFTVSTASLACVAAGCMKSSGVLEQFLTAFLHWHSLSALLNLVAMTFSCQELSPSIVSVLSESVHSIILNAGTVQLPAECLFELCKSPNGTELATSLLRIMLNGGNVEMEHLERNLADLGKLLEVINTMDPGYVLDNYEKILDVMWPFVDVSTFEILSYCKPLGKINLDTDGIKAMVQRSYVWSLPELGGVSARTNTSTTPQQELSNNIHQVRARIDEAFTFLDMCSPSSCVNSLAVTWWRIFCQEAVEHFKGFLVADKTEAISLVISFISRCLEKQCNTLTLEWTMCSCFVPECFNGMTSEPWMAEEADQLLNISKSLHDRVQQDVAVHSDSWLLELEAEIRSHHQYLSGQLYTAVAFEQCIDRLDICNKLFDMYGLNSIGYLEPPQEWMAELQQYQQSIEWLHENEVCNIEDLIQQARMACREENVTCKELKAVVMLAKEKLQVLMTPLRVCPSGTDSSNVLAIDYLQEMVQSGSSLFRLMVLKEMPPNSSRDLGDVLCTLRLVDQQFQDLLSLELKMSDLEKLQSGFSEMEALCCDTEILGSLPFYQSIFISGTTPENIARAYSVKKYVELVPGLLKVFRIAGVLCKEHVDEDAENLEKCHCELTDQQPVKRFLSSFELVSDLLSSIKPHHMEIVNFVKADVTLLKFFQQMEIYKNEAEWHRVTERVALEATDESRKVMVTALKSCYQLLKPFALHKGGSLRESMLLLSHCPHSGGSVVKCLQVCSENLAEMETLVVAAQRENRIRTRTIATTLLQSGCVQFHLRRFEGKPSFFTFNYPGKLTTDDSSSVTITMDQSEVAYVKNQLLLYCNSDSVDQFLAARFRDLVSAVTELQIVVCKLETGNHIDFQWRDDLNFDLSDQKYMVEQQHKFEEMQSTHEQHLEEDLASVNLRAYCTVVTLKKQLREKTPNISEMMSALACSIFQTSSEFQGLFQTLDLKAVIQIYTAINVMLQEDATTSAHYQLLPCLLCLYLEFFQWHHYVLRDIPGTPTASSSFNTGQCTKSLDRASQELVLGISNIVKEWLNSFSELPVQYDSLLIESKGFTENFQLLLNPASPSASHDVDGPFLAILARILQPNFPSDALCTTNVLNGFITFLRLDMKYCYVCHMESSEMWQRYMHFDWTNLPSVTSMDFCDGVMAAIGHCNESGCFNLLGVETGSTVLRWLSGLSVSTPVNEPVSLDECWAILQKVLAYRDGTSCSLDVIFSSLLKDTCQSSSRTFQVSTKLVYSIVQVCRSEKGGVMDALFGMCAERLGLPALLTLVSDIHDSKDFTSHAIGVVAETFNRVVISCLSLELELRDLEKFFSHSECSRALAISLLKVILSGGSVKIVNVNQHLSDLGKLLESVDKAEPEFVTDNWQCIVKVLWPLGEDSPFNIILRCKPLNKITVTLSDTTELMHIPSSWKLTPDEGSNDCGNHHHDEQQQQQQQHRQQQQEQLQKCMKAALTDLLKCGSNQAENSLAFFLWKTFCELAVGHIQRFLTADKAATISSFVSFLSTLVVKFPDLSVSLWTLCSYTVRECFNGVLSTPWMLEEADQLLNISKSLHDCVLQDGSVYPAGSDTWLLEMEAKIQSHHKYLSGGLYVTEAFEQCIRRLEVCNKLFEMYSLDSISHLEPPQEFMNELQQYQQSIEWLHENEVCNIEDLMQQVRMACREENVTCKELKAVVMLAKEKLQVLMTPLRVCPSGTDSSNVLAIDYLQEMVQSGSSLFRLMVLKEMPPNSSRDLGDVLCTLRLVDQQFQDLLSLELKMSDLEKLQSGFSEMEAFCGDTEILGSSPFYQSTVTSGTTSENIARAYSVKKYLELVPVLLEVFRIAGVLCKEHVDEDAENLEKIHRELTDQQPLKRFLSSFELVSDLLSSIKPHHMEIVNFTRADLTLLRFFQQKQTYKNEAEWERVTRCIALRATDRYRKSMLLTALKSCHQLLKPFALSKSGSLRKSLLLLSKCLPSGGSLDKCLQVCSENLPEIEKLVDAAQHENLERALVVAETLLRSGCVQFHLRRFEGKPSYLQYFTFNDKSATNDVRSVSKEMDQDEIADLYSLVLSCQYDAIYRAQVCRFQSKMSAVGKLLRIVFKLESSGHLDMQCRGPLVFPITSDKHLMELCSKYDKMYTNLTQHLKDSHVWKNDDAFNAVVTLQQELRLKRPRLEDPCCDVLSPTASSTNGWNYYWQVYRAADKVLMSADTTAYELLPRVLYIYLVHHQQRFKESCLKLPNNLPECATSHASPVSPSFESNSDNSVSKLLGSWLGRLAQMPALYDELLMKKGGFTDNFRIVLNTFFQEAACAEKGPFQFLITEVLRLQKSLKAHNTSTLKNILNGFITFLRLDMKYCYLCHMESSEMWQRYMHFDWTNLPSVTSMDFCDGVMAAIGHCNESGCFNLLGVDTGSTVLRWLSGLSVSTPVNEPVSLEECWAIYEKLRIYIDGEVVNFNRIFSSILKKIRQNPSYTLKVSTKLVCVIIQVCRSQRDGVLDMLFRLYSERLGLPALLTLVSDIHDSKDFTSHAFGVVAETFNRVVISCLSLELELRDLEKFFSHSECSRALAISLLKVILSGGSVKIINMNQHLSGLGKLLESVDKAEPEFVADNWQCIVKVLWPLGGDSPFNIILSCKPLGRLNCILDKESRPIAWKLPPLHQFQDLQYRKRRGLQEKVQKCVEQALKCVRNCCASLAETSLVFIWWKELCDEVCRHFKSFLTVDKAGTVASFVLFLNRLVVNWPDLSVLLWTLCSSVVPDCFNRVQSQPWMVDGADRLVNLSRSLHTRVQQDDSVYPAGSDGWLADMQKVILLHHKLLSEKQYTAEQFGQLSATLDAANKLFVVLNKSRLDPLKSPMDLFPKLVKRQTVICWLCSNGVTGLAEHQELVNVVHSNCMSTPYAKIVNTLETLNDILQPFDSRVQSLSNSSHAAIWPAEDGLFQIMKAGSLLFKSLVFRRLSSLSAFSLSEAGDAVHRAFHCLYNMLKGEVTLKSLKELEPVMSQLDLDREAQLLIQLPVFARIGSTINLSDCMRKALHIERFVLHLRAILNFFRMYRIVDEDDSIRHLQCACEQFNDEQTLNTIIISFKQWNSIIPNISSYHLDIVATMGGAQQLAGFYNDQQFREDPQQWRLLSERMDMQARNKSLNTRLLDAFNVVHTSLEPLIVSEFPTAYEALAYLTTIKVSVMEQTAPFLRVVCDNITALVQMVKEAQSGSIQNALQLIEYLQATGQVTFYLNRFHGKPSRSTISHSKDVNAAGTSIVQVNLDIDQEFDLRRQLLLLQHDPEYKETASAFLSTLQEIDSVKEVLCKLEVLGHPEYQATSIVHSDLSSPSHLEAKRTELKSTLVSWREELERLYCEESVMLVLSTSQIGHLLALTNPGKSAGAVVSQMTSRSADDLPAWTQGQAPSEGETLLLDKCIRSILNSTLGLTKAIPVSDRKIRKLLNKRSQSSSGSPREHLTYLQFLVNCLLSTDPNGDHDPSQGKQHVCSVSTTRIPSLMYNKILSLLNVADRGPLPSQCQLMFCSTETTVGELQQFVTRANVYIGRRFLMVGVDRLNSETGRQLVKLQQSQYQSDQRGDICYVFVDSPVSTSTILQKLDASSCDLPAQKELVLELLKKHHNNGEHVATRPKIKVYCGAAGVGKSTSIRADAGKPFDAVISINDHPHLGGIIRRLNSLPEKADVHFNISANAPFEVVDGIFFQLLVHGSLVDDHYGTTFAFPLQTDWTWWIELPHSTTWRIDKPSTAGKNYTAQLFPSLSIFSAESHMVTASANFCIEDREQFVAKYVAGYRNISSRGKRVIDNKGGRPVYSELSETQCRCELTWLFQNYNCRLKAHKAMLIRCLHRRFSLFTKKVFLKNEDNSTLGSDLMEQFLQEAKFLSRRHLSCSWEDCRQSFVIPDTSGICFCPLYPTHSGLAYQSTSPGFQRLTCGGEAFLKSSEIGRWESCLAWILGLKPSRVKELLAEKSFVLMEDFAFKMLLIHERKMSRIPLIIEGETGVGKTFLLEMYAILLNEQPKKKLGAREKTTSLMALTCKWLSETILEMPEFRGMRRLQITAGLAQVSIEEYLRSGTCDIQGVVSIWSLLLSTTSDISTTPDNMCLTSIIKTLQEFLLKSYSELPVLSPKAEVVTMAQRENISRDQSCDLLQQFLSTPSHSLLRRLLIHPGISPHDVEKFLTPVIELAIKIPSVELIVFFDEINTSSCLGLFKEILMDGMLNGRRLPVNILFIGAINPFIEEDKRDTSSLLGSTVMSVSRDVYFVHKLPDAMESIIWRYGSIHDDELLVYIKCKVDAIADQAIGYRFQAPIPANMKTQAATCILAAQRFCKEKISIRSVSQRDVNRVFRLSTFFLNWLIPSTSADGGRSNSYFCVALWLAVGVVYYLRLPIEGSNAKDGVTRTDFISSLSFGAQFLAEFHAAVNRFVNGDNFLIPDGIALNQALKENVFALVACVQSRVPIGIIGAPGSSKTLSFHIVRDNLLGASSPKLFCKQFATVHCFFYQCSEHTTSNEVKDTLERAIAKQAVYNSNETANVRCVVLLDEAGLPKEDMNQMVLKVLHPYLDECKVSFVAISNHHFDSANQNRMVTVLRSVATLDDLVTLSLGCIGRESEGSDLNNARFMEGVCRGFLDLIANDRPEIKQMFHYRDLVYLFRYIYCRRKEDPTLVADGKLLLQALERNFNGVHLDVFQDIVETFLTAVREKMCNSFLSNVVGSDYRSIVDILCSALPQSRDPSGNHIPTGDLFAPRFKLVIDPTDDLSALRLLRDMRVMDSSMEHCKVFCMSDLPNDHSSMHAAEVIAGIKYYVERPATVILVNCSRIYGSLYDILNQNFLRTVAVGNTDCCQSQKPVRQAYANIAMGSVTYNCPVNPQFQCIVFLRQSDLPATPAPFLSRFEKYLLPVGTFFDVQVEKLHPGQATAVKNALVLCEGFVKHLGVNSFYGFKEDNTLTSLFLSHIRPAASEDDHFQFKLLTAPLHKLREGRHHSRLLDSCSPIQQIVRCVCSELLQLVPPEIFLLKLSSLKEADVYSYIYFNILQNNSSGLTEIVKDRTPTENTDVKSFKTTCSSKLMIFSRISGTLQSLHLTFNEFFGSSVSQHMRVESASIYQSKASIDSMLEEFERSEKTCCLVTVHPRKIDDLRIWHQLMSDAKTENSKGISKFYILCFAIPAIDIHFESCYTASFLSGWNCMYLDSMKIPPIPLCHFSTLFVREAVGLTNNLASSERPSESATSSLMREHECNQYLYESAVREFVCGVRSLFPAKGRLPDMTAGQFYWNNKTARSRALKYVLDKQPLVWQRAQQLLYQVLNDDKLFQVIREVAVDIVSKKVSCSLSTQVSDYVRSVVVGVFGFLVTQLCHSYGLATIFKWNDETLYCLLKLAAAPTTYQMEQGSEWIIDCITGQNIRIQTPFFLLINNRIQACLEPYKTIQLQELHDHILSDKNLSVLLQSTQAENFQRCFCSDHLLLQVYRKSSALSADSAERKAVDIILCWLDRCRESEFPSASLMALTYWACTTKANEVRVLFDVSVALLNAGHMYEDSDLQRLPKDPAVFLKFFLWESFLILWKTLINIGTGPVEEFQNRVSDWQAAFKCISVCAVQNFPGLIDTCTSEEASQVGLTKAFNRLLSTLGVNCLQHLLSAASSILDTARSKSVLVSVVHHVGVVLTQQTGEVQRGTMCACLDFVLFWLESVEEVQNHDTKPVLALLDSVLQSGSMHQFRQISVEILQCLRRRPKANLDINLVSMLSQWILYIPMICPDHNPDLRPLAHAYFDEYRQHLKTQHLSLEQLLQDEAQEHQSLYHSIRQTAARFVLMDRFIAVISKPSQLQVEPGFRDVFNTLLNKRPFRLSPPTPYCLYMLRNITTRLGQDELSRSVRNSTISWWKQSIEKLGPDTPTTTGLSFMFSKVDAQQCGFSEASALYLQLKTVLGACSKGKFSPVVEWFQTKINQRVSMDRFPIKSWPKGLLLLVVFFEYFCKNKHGELKGLYEVLQRLFPEMGHCHPMELLVFRLFLDDSFRDTATVRFPNVFAPGKKDENDTLVRGVLVNFLVCSLFFTSSTPSHWTTLLTKPDSLNGSYFFGASYYSRLSSVVKIDCCCQFQADGGRVGEVSSGSGLSLRGSHVSAFFTFAALFWHSLIIDESKPAAVLTRRYVERETSAQLSYKHRIQEFCFRRVRTFFVHISTGSSTRDIMGKQKCSLLLTRCLEYLSHYVRTHRQVFRETFEDREARQKAESIFQLDIVQRAFEQGSPRFDSIQPTDLQESVSGFPDFVSYSVGLSDMAESLKSEAHTATISLAPLACFVSKLEVLKQIKLFPNLMALFKLIHHKCPGKFRRDSKLTDIALLTEGGCVEDGIKAFNLFHDLSNGQIRSGPCTAENSFGKARSDSTLIYFLRYLSIMLVNIMEYQNQLLDNVFDVVDAIEQTDDTAVCLFKEKMAILKACCEQQGKVKVEHLDLSSREPEGLLHIDLEEIDRIVSCYSYKIFPPRSSQSHSYQWMELQYSLLYNVMKRAYRDVDIVFVRKDSIELLEHVSEFGIQDLAAREKLHDVPQEMMIDLDCCQREELSLFAAGNLYYDQSRGFLRILSKISRELWRPVSSDIDSQPTSVTALRDMPLHQCVAEILDGHHDGVYNAFLSKLESLRIQLHHIKAVHSLIAKHLESLGYLHVDLQETIRLDLQSGIKNQLTRQVELYLSKRNVGEGIQLVKEIIAGLIASRNVAHLDIAKPLKDILLEGCSRQAKEFILTCFPAEVKCQNMAGVISVLVKSSYPLYAEMASDSNWQKAKSLQWSDCDGGSNATNADGLLMSSIDAQPRPTGQRVCQVESSRRDR